MNLNKLNVQELSVEDTVSVEGGGVISDLVRFIIEVIRAIDNNGDGVK